MADLYGDPTLGAMTQPLPVNPAGNVEQYRMGWLEALQNPAVKAGLLQFGLQAMQPVPIQQTGAGGMASAIGAGVGAYNRNIDEQNRAQQTNQENAFKSEELGLKSESIDVQREGNRQQYDVGLKGIDAKNTNALLVSQNRLVAAQISAATRADVATQGAMAEWAQSEALFGRPVTAESAKDFLATINVGKSPAIPVPGTEGATPSQSVETPLPTAQPEESGAVQRPATLEAARALKAGTHYIDPDTGQEMIRGGSR